MREYKPTKKQPNKKFLDTALRTKSWQPVARNGWIIKFSVFRDTNVLLTVISQYTGQVIIRHFTNEDDACMFINLVIELSADETYEL
jgi:hypothetical protein